MVNNENNTDSDELEQSTAPDILANEGSNSDEESTGTDVIEDNELNSKKSEEGGETPFRLYNKAKARYQQWKRDVIKETSEEREEDEIYGTDWNQLGYQRTIAGFLYTFGLLIPQVLMGLALAPLIQYTEMRYVEVQGIAAVAAGLFGALYMILDLDLQDAINRFVPQYAISDPKKAMQYVSFFVKYQMWSGLFQITGVSAFILYYLIPTNSQFAYVSWYMLFICVKQYPATLGTFKGLLDSLQQKNKANLIVFYRASIIEPLTKLGGGIIGLMYGYANPAWGPMMGLSLGAAIGGYVDDFFTFTLGTYWLSKVLEPYGIKIRDIYANKVPSEVWKSALWFSARLMPKTLFDAILGWSGYIIKVDGMPGYTTYHSLTNTASNLAKFVTWSDDIINQSRPAFSEAYNNNKVALTRFYIANGLKYNFWMLGFLGTFNIVCLPAIIDIAIPVFMPEEWRPITQMVPVYIMLFFYKPFKDVAEKMIFLSGHPEVNTAIKIVQSLGNLFFTWFFIIYLEIGWLGLVLAGVPMDLFAFFVQWIYMSKKILKIDFKFWKDIGWQVFVAPALATAVFGVAIYLVAYVLYPVMKIPFLDVNFLGVDGGGILIPGAIMLIMLLLLLVFLYMPLYAYFGGWDNRTLNIFRKAVPLTGPSLWLIYPLYKIMMKFHEKSPFKKRAYMRLGDDAQEELYELAILREKNLDEYNKKNKLD